MNIVSLFSGAGGLDLGFNRAGFKTIWANEYDKDIWETFEKNHKQTQLDRRSITAIEANEIPDCVGIIGGPPCQSWSEAGLLKGLKDKRGQLFLDFVRILEAKKPLFFLAENVHGMLFKRHDKALKRIIKSFESVGYTVSYRLLNAKNFNVPQDRRRVIFVGYRKDVLDKKFVFPEGTENFITLKDAIGDLAKIKPAPVRTVGDIAKVSKDNFPNHEYYTSDYSSMFMSRNRVRSWDEVSYTIQAGARHAPIHPQAPKMHFVEKDKYEFVRGKEKLYRRLSVRECARIQTFPDDFIFYYTKVSAGYKMIGNAVPVNFANALALSILNDLVEHDLVPKPNRKISRQIKQLLSVV